MGAWSTKEKTTAVGFPGRHHPLAVQRRHLIFRSPSSRCWFWRITLPGIGVCRTWRDLRIEWGGVVLLVGGFVVGVAASKTGLAAWVVQKALHPMAASRSSCNPSALPC